MEVEINFRFDQNGRTANTKVERNRGGNETSNENSTGKKIDYGFRAAMTDLKKSFDETMSSSTTENNNDHKSLLDEILLDCEISDNLIMPRTYWILADGETEARCALEQFALDIFHHHVPPTLEFDRETSGAEWWCQLRPSPETGRHRAVAKKLQECDGEGNNDNGDEDRFTNGISFHVDKDEELRILTGGTTYVHPHLSTITYLTNFGSPTLIMDCQVHPLTGEWIVPSSKVEGFVSWPSVGKHTSFDGRYLHASPLDLMGTENTFSKQLKEAATKLDEQTKNNSTISEKSKRRRCRRVTFLVNIWLNYKPYDVHPFPELMIDKMSGRDKNKRPCLRFEKAPPSESMSIESASNPESLWEDKNPLHVQKWYIRSDQASEVDVGAVGLPSSSSDGPATISNHSSATSTEEAQRFSWPLGDASSGERLVCFVPMSSMAEVSKTGGNLRFQWQTTETKISSFQLFDGKSPSSPCDRAAAEASREAVVHGRMTTTDEDGVTAAPTNKRPRNGEATASSAGMR